MGRRIGEGTYRLANTISNRIMRQTSGEKTLLDFGTVLENDVIKPDSLPDFRLSGNDYSILKGIGKLKKDDRVSLIWVGEEPVVAGIIDE